MAERQPLDLSEPEELPEAVQIGMVATNALLVLAVGLLAISLGWGFLRGAFT